MSPAISAAVHSTADDATGVVGFPRGGPAPVSDDADRGRSTIALLQRWGDYAVTAAGLKEETALRYSRVLTAMASDLKTELADVSEEQLIGWLSTRGGGGRGWNREVRIRAIRHFFAWAARRGILERDPSLELKIGKRPRPKPRWIDPPDITAILEAASGMPDERVGPTLALMCFTGCRVGSLCGALVDDVDLERRELHWRKAKKDVTYTSPLNDEAMVAVRRLIALRDYAPYAGVRRITLVGVGEERVRQWLTEACDRAQVKRVTPHQFRHSFGTAIATNPDIDIRSWVALMGHSGPGEFTRYAGTNRGRLHEAVASFRLPPPKAR